MKFLFTIVFFVEIGFVSAQVPNNLSASDKVFGLSKIWEEANYNFVYMNRVDRNMWDSTYRKYISMVQTTKDDYTYYRILQRFIAQLHDGHSNIFLPTSLDSLVLVSMFGPYRFYVENIDGKAVVVQTNLSKKDEIPVGSEIVQVNNMPTKEYREKWVVPYVSASTDFALEDISTEKLLEGLLGESYTVTFKKPDGKTTTLQLTHAKTAEKEMYPALEEHRDLLEFKWYPGKIAYVSLNSFADRKIDSEFVNLLPELYKAKGLIIDLRKNGGGNTNIGAEILTYLTHDTVFYGARSYSRMHIPAYKAWGGGVRPQDTVGSAWQKKVYLYYHDLYEYSFDYSPDTVHMRTPRVVVPTALLIGHNTFSAAEDFLIYADKQKHFVKIGQNSSGSTGQPYFFRLPGGGGARVCAKKDTYPDGREFVGYGVKPDIEVKPTLDDFIHNKDVVLERALEWENGK